MLMSMSKYRRSAFVKATLSLQSCSVLPRDDMADGLEPGYNDYYYIDSQQKMTDKAADRRDGNIDAIQTAF
jgi:hypothetical protein